MPKTQSITGVEVQVTDEQTFLFHAISVQLNKQQLQTNSQISNCRSIEDLQEKLSTNKPLVLCVNGRGVIFREAKHTQDSAEALNEVLPNANPQEFYIQFFKVESKTFVALARKDLIDKILQTFKQAKLRVLQLYLGPYVLFGVNSLIEKRQNGIISLPPYQLIMENEKITSVESVNGTSEQEHILLGQEKINSSAVVAFSAAFHYLLPTLKVSSLEHSDVLWSRKEERYKKILSRYGAIALAILFIGLLANYFLFEHYSERYRVLENAMSQKKQVITQIDLLENELKQKQDIFTQVGMDVPSKSSYYSDRIANTLIPEIQLLSMEINPVEKKPKKEEKITLVPHRIDITGNASSAENLNNWLKHLRENLWIKQLEIMQFEDDSKVGKGTFELRIYFDEITG